MFINLKKRIIGANMITKGAINVQTNILMKHIKSPLKKSVNT